MERELTRRPESLGLHLGKEEEFVRFDWRARLEHLLLMVSFIALVVTGAPQRFYYTPWGEALVLAMGGIEMVRTIHRLFAAMLILESVFHAVNLAYGLVTNRRVPAMLPQLKDLKDLVRQLLYYFGRRKKGPDFGRYDYAQKFEYWGVVWGTAVMILTGLVMIFPAQFTTLLPGELVPAAKGVHGGEALLALLVIVTWHLYGTHLKPSKFPFDATIFTGKISQSRMLEEHPLEYAQMTGLAAALERTAPSGRGSGRPPQNPLSRVGEADRPAAPEGEHPSQ